MLAATYRVTIERHEVGDIPALTFVCEGAKPSCPLVFALHGLTSRKERHLDLCLRLADAGFRACSFDARSHGERRDEASTILSGDRTDPGFLPAFARTVLGTIEDMATLAGYFGGERYAIVGHSMGGFIAMQAALHDPRVVAVANIAGSLESATPRFDLPEELRALQAKADVVARAAELRPRPILLLHGAEDTTVPARGAETLATALKTAYAGDAEQIRLIVYPDTGHELVPRMAADAVAWLTEQWQRL